MSGGAQLGPALVVQHLTKRFGARVAYDDVCFEVGSPIVSKSCLSMRLTSSPLDVIRWSHAHTTGTYDDALERFHRIGPEFDGYLSNHGPMVVEVLEVLARWNQDPLIDRCTDRYLRRLDELPRGGWPIDPLHWQDALGEPARSADWIELLQREVDQETWRNVLARWWPRLLPGIAAGATHGYAELMRIFLDEAEVFQDVHDQFSAPALYLQLNLLANMALLLEVKGDFQLAASFWGRVFDKFRGARSAERRSFEVAFLYRLALLELKAGAGDRARQAMDRALEVPDMASAFTMERLLYGKGHVELEAGDAAAAGDTFAAGCALALRLCHDEGLADHLIELAEGADGGPAFPDDHPHRAVPGGQPRPLLGRVLWGALRPAARPPAADRPRYRGGRARGRRGRGTGPGPDPARRTGGGAAVRPS